MDEWDEKGCLAQARMHLMRYEEPEPKRAMAQAALAGAWIMLAKAKAEQTPQEPK